jgi:hypothetical protein
MSPLELLLRDYPSQTLRVLRWYAAKPDDSTADMPCDRDLAPVWQTCIAAGLLWPIGPNGSNRITGLGQLVRRRLIKEIILKEADADPPADPLPPAGVEQPQGPPIEGKTTAKVSLDARAVGVFVAHPDWTKKQIADHLHCNEKSLAPRRCPKLDAAMHAHKAKIDPDRRRLHGTKDGEGNLEAWEEG